MHLAIDTQTRHAAIGIDVKADMGPDAIIGYRAEVMGIAGEIGGGKDLGPLRRRIGIAAAAAGLQRGRWGIIAGEMAGIDIDSLDHARPAEPHGAMVVSRPTAAPALPALHPFPVCV